jgi:hypothetical protein
MTVMTSRDKTYGLCQRLVTEGVRFNMEKSRA